MKGKTRFPTFQGSRGTTVLEGLTQKDPNADLQEKSSSVSSCNVPWKGEVGESESRDQVYSRDALLSLYRPQSLPQSLLSFYPGLDPDGAEDSSCDALKEMFNDFGNDGTDQYDQFGDLRSEVAQQYIASNSLSSNANLLLSTTRQEDSASNIITQQLRELKGGVPAPPGFSPPGFSPPGFSPPGFAPPGFAPPGFAPPGFAPRSSDYLGHEPILPPFVLVQPVNIPYNQIVAPPGMRQLNPNGAVPFHPNPAVSADSGTPLPSVSSVPPFQHTNIPSTQKQRSKFMSPSDIRFIVGKVLQPIQSNDPFADDFYFLQRSIRKNASMREKALKEKSEIPPMIFVPLPTWKETKDRIRLQMEATKNIFKERRRQWEETEKVLGHVARTDISRPRELLSLPNWSEVLDVDLDEDTQGDGEFRSPFSSRLWSVRASVQRGFEALYTVQELRQLLNSPVISSNPAASAEIAKDIDAAVILLSQSIGIRTVVPALASAEQATNVAAEFSLDGGHVGALLQTPKGKNLVGRSVKLLLPEHRWALLPVIIAKVLQSPSGASPENLTVEHSLLRTIIEFLQFSFQYHSDLLLQAQQGPPAASSAAAGFANVLVIHLRQCLKTAMVTQMEKHKLRQTLLSDRARAELMHVIVQIGDKVATSGICDAQLCEEWTQTREAFMVMLDS